ncbi:MAG: phenylalanine--tRNA ligase subunit beta [Chthonomonas sp.]|nr:phenylalanine--tRNA ligase subunit beta [Chthonomonas sp.]
MKLPASLLRAFVDTPLSSEEIGDLLTMAGFELEGIENDVLDIKVMANRGDGLSALGLAREVLAKDPGSKPTALYEKIASMHGAKGEPSSRIDLQSENCTRYACAIYSDVQNGASPKWLQDTLTAAGQRPISLLVDLTNLVMLELGQPLHAFDLEKLYHERIVVRQAKTGEKLTTLNGDEHELKPNHLMICDAEKPVAVAGVMGGLETEVSASTKRMLLESAHFDGSSVRKTRKELGLNTDASYRFERSVDPNGVVRAIQRFDELYREITGAAGAGVIEDVFAKEPVVASLQLRPERARMIWAMDISDGEMTGYLERLGFTVSAGSPMSVTPPSWRPDVTLEEDVIEEIGRVHGYEKIPDLMPIGTTTRGGTFGLYAVIDTAKKTMLRCGLDQMISHSLRDVSILDFNPDRRVTVRNPHSPEMAYLRSSLLPGLAEAALKNGGRNLHIFEIGKVFVKGDYEVDESPELGILITGAMQEVHFGQKGAPQADFWTLKGILVELGHLVHDDISFELPRLPDHRFHPTRQAGIMVDQGRLWVGTAGQIHPDYAEQLGLPEETYMAEIDLLVFFQNPDDELHVKPISRYPAIKRDIAFVISKSVPYADVEKAITEASGDVLEKQSLFDIYEGQGIEPGKHSLAVNIQLRKLDGSFTDEEANVVRDNVIRAIEGLGGVLR